MAEEPGEALADWSCRSLEVLPPSLAAAPPRHALLEFNLAFNSLRSLHGLVDACPQLQRLCAAHNQIASLPALHMLPQLCRVDLSSNRLVAVSPLERCASLTELWLSSNQLPLEAALPLREAISLRALVLSRNPSERALPAGMYRHLTLLALPQLTSFDAHAVGGEARRDALAFLRTHQPRAALAEAVGTKQALALLRGAEAAVAAHAAGEPPRAPPSRASAVAAAPRRHGGGGGGFTRPACAAAQGHASSVPSEASGEEALLHARQRLEESERALHSARAVSATQRAARQAPRCGRRAAAPLPARSAVSSVPSAADDFTLHYPSGGVAVLVRSDGSCTCRWPNGTVAVTVDRARGPLGFEMRASFRRGGIAAAVDSSGNGFVYRSDGSELLRRETRGGKLWTRVIGADGVEVDSWSSPVESVGATPAEEGGPHSSQDRFTAVLEQQLALIVKEDGCMRLAFSVGSISYLITHGANKQQPFWDENDDFLSQFRGQAQAARPAKSGGPRAQQSLPSGCMGNVSEGIAGIADALAMLPDLHGKVSRPGQCCIKNVAPPP